MSIQKFLKKGLIFVRKLFIVKSKQTIAVQKRETIRVESRFFTVWLWKTA